MTLQSIKEKFRMTEEQRQFYKMTASLTLPIALQNLMDTAVSGADVLMLNFVSEAAISAASAARGPVIRTMAMAPPGPLEMAAAVSSLKSYILFMAQPQGSYSSK